MSIPTPTKERIGGGVLFGDWEREREGAALVFVCALGPDAPAVDFDEGLRNCQPDARTAASGAQAGFIDAVEPVKAVKLF